MTCRAINLGMHPMARRTFAEMGIVAIGAFCRCAMRAMTIGALHGLVHARLVLLFDNLKSVLTFMTFGAQLG